MATARLVGLTLLSAALLAGIAQVCASGAFELKLLSFKNDLGINADGDCCNGIREGSRCTSQCRTFFRVCLKEWKANLLVKPFESCTFGNSTTPVVGDNTFPFLDTITGLDNPIRFKFDFSWLGTFSLIIEALNEVAPGAPAQLIYRRAVQESVAVSPEWSVYPATEGVFAEAGRANPTLGYQYRVVCDPDYYGNACNQHCADRDDAFGHYTCNQLGLKECMEGWEGTYCDKPKCMSGCQYGTCKRPNECECRPGWQGKACDECIRFPGCTNGECTKPWDCECREGWGGLFCNQDLNFCTNHRPCKNGATCTNTGHGSYTCTCPPGYTGNNCEIEINDCALRPCQNGGTCTLNEAGKTQCTCRAGFHGSRCQSNATRCEEGPCQNGGSCIALKDSYTCICRPGFTGINCEVPVDKCVPNPCQNGGHCETEAGGYRCICMPGFKGVQCEAERDECHPNPCLNSGICHDRVNSFDCQCKAGYVGPLCQENVDDCATRPCANGGTCYDGENTYSCDCTPGFTSKDCTEERDECDSSPCLNGARCVDKMNDFECVCPAGYVGKRCNIPAFASPDSASTSATRAPSTPPPSTTKGGGSALPAITSPQDNSPITMKQLLLIICLGVGIPIIVIIVIIVYLLCKNRRNSQADEVTVAKDNEQNERNITNMNNKNLCLDANVISGIPSSSASLKLTNEEQGRVKTIHNTTRGPPGHLNVDRGHQPYSKNYQKDLNTKHPAKNTKTNELLDTRDLLQRSRDVRDSQKYNVTSHRPDQVGSSLESSTAEHGEYSGEVHLAKPINTEANSNSIFYLDKPYRHPPYTEAMLATEV